MPTREPEKAAARLYSIEYPRRLETKERRRGRRRRKREAAHRRMPGRMLEAEKKRRREVRWHQERISRIQAVQWLTTNFIFDGHFDIEINLLFYLIHYPINIPEKKWIWFGNHSFLGYQIYNKNDNGIGQCTQNNYLFDGLPKTNIHFVEINIKLNKMNAYLIQ